MNLELGICEEKFKHRCCFLQGTEAQNKEWFFLEFMEEFRLSVKISVWESRGCRGQLIIGVVQVCRAG